MKILIVTTGGTIDKVYFDAKSDYEIGESQIPQILAESHVTVDYEMANVLRKDSLELDDEDRALIRRTVEGSDCDRVVVTHGTDTMVETAKVLEGIPGKTIVFTGSLSPARFRNSDAVFNVGMAVAAAQSLPPGVYLAMNGRIFSPRHVRKNREANRFEEVGES
ncbi:asparaginase domain-containing protein [bacterium]|nr:asparaginase domain-containing protein [bacterium]